MLLSGAHVCGSMHAGEVVRNCARMDRSDFLRYAAPEDCDDLEKHLAARKARQQKAGTL